jgi:hypothetical protein
MRRYRPTLSFSPDGSKIARSPDGKSTTVIDFEEVEPNSVSKRQP